MKLTNNVKASSFYNWATQDKPKYKPKELLDNWFENGAKEILSYTPMRIKIIHVEIDGIVIGLTIKTYATKVFEILAIDII